MNRLLILLFAVILCGCVVQRKPQMVPVQPLVQSIQVVPQKPLEAKQKPLKKKDSIIVYGASWCSPCKALKASLESKGIDFDYVDIDTDTVPPHVMKYIDAHGIPTVDFNGTVGSKSVLKIN